MTPADLARLVSTYITYQCPACSLVMDYRPGITPKTCPDAPACPGKPRQVLKAMGLKPPPETAK